MLDDVDEDQLRKYGLLRRKRTPQYWHPYVGQGSNTWVMAPVDQDDVAEIDRMLEAGAGPTEIKKWLDNRYEDQWGDVLLLLARS
jgi:hypothetical protein